MRASETLQREQGIKAALKHQCDRGELVPITTIDAAFESARAKLSQPQSAPRSGPPAGTTVSPTTPAGNLFTVGNASPEVRAILDRRLPLEQMVRGCRAILSHEERCQTDARYIAQARSDLTEAVNALAVFDLEQLTQECRDRLTAFGVPFTYSTETLRAAAE